MALAADCAVSISAFRPKEAARPASQQFERLNGTGLRIAYRYKLPPPQPRLNSTGPFRSVSLSANRAGIERRNGVFNRSVAALTPADRASPSLTVTHHPYQKSRQARFQARGPFHSLFRRAPFRMDCSRLSAGCFLLSFVSSPSHRRRPPLLPCGSRHACRRLRLPCLDLPASDLAEIPHVLPLRRSGGARGASPRQPARTQSFSGTLSTIPASVGPADARVASCVKGMASCSSAVSEPTAAGTPLEGCNACL